MSNASKRPRRRPFDSVQELTPEERKELRGVLDSPLFRKALSRVHSMKPPALTALPSVQEKNDRLCQIQGWELFEHALFLQTQTPRPRAEAPTETFPNSGLIDYE